MTSYYLRRSLTKFSRDYYAIFYVPCAEYRCRNVLENEQEIIYANKLYIIKFINVKLPLNLIGSSVISRCGVLFLCIAPVDVLFDLKEPEFRNEGGCIHNMS